MNKLKLALYILRVPAYILTSSGVGTITASAIGAVPIDKKNMIEKVSVYVGAWALQSMTAYHAANHVDEIFTKAITAVEAVEGLSKILSVEEEISK